jgi:hypothetical protein
MLPEAVMHQPAELRRWIARAFEGALRLPPKEAKPGNAVKTPPRTRAKKSLIAKKPAKQR